MKEGQMYRYTYDGVRRVSGLRRDPAEIPQTSNWNIEKQTPTLPLKWQRRGLQFWRAIRPC